MSKKDKKVPVKVEKPARPIRPTSKEPSDVFSIYKSLNFPEEVVPEKAEASLKGGVLGVNVPKTPTSKPKKHKVEMK